MATIKLIKKKRAIVIDKKTKKKREVEKVIEKMVPQREVVRYIAKGYEIYKPAPIAKPPEKDK